MPILAVAAAAEQPSPQILRRLEHEYRLGAFRSGHWAVSPLILGASWHAVARLRLKAALMGSGQFYAGHVRAARSRRWSRPTASALMVSFTPASPPSPVPLRAHAGTGRASLG
jgi:hypothetical protein